MRGMNLNEIEAGREGAARRVAKGLDNGRNAGVIKSSGNGVVGGRKGNRAGSNRLPAAIGGQHQSVARER